MASSDALVADIVATLRGKAPGIAATPEFATWSKGLPTEANSFVLVTPAFTQTLADFKAAIVDKAIEEDPEIESAMPVIDLIFSGEVYYVYQVGARTETGLLTATNSSQSGISMIATQFLAVPLTVAAAVGMPQLIKARQNAKRERSASKLRYIGLGMLMYSGDNGGPFPTPDGAAGLDVLDKNDVIEIGDAYIDPYDEGREIPEETITEATTSYAYIGAGLRAGNTDAATLPLLIEKPAGTGWANVLYSDGHLEGFPYDGVSLEGIIDALDDRYDYDKPLYQRLMDKARKLDTVTIQD
jgi:hypothetical protein